ncbi:MAG: DUF6448 family protein [Planctomycetota bacterium]|jgi:hypothetical protein
MKDRKKIYALFALGTFVCGFVFAVAVYAHCDSMSGPVIPEAMAALEKGDIIPVLKWIKPEYETEVKKAFSLAVQVRDKSHEAKELADKYFLETLIRLHRAGEGAPYTGIKENPPEKIIILTDQALASGSADELIKKIQTHLAEAIREKFNKALQASRNKDKSVESGRDFVEAYVQYTHYVEGIHAAIISTGSHHADSQKHSEPTEHKH